MAFGVAVDRDLTASIELGGAEDGTATWASPVTITCSTEDFEDVQAGEKVDVTARCDDYKKGKGTHIDRQLRVTVDVPATGVKPFGEAIHVYCRFTYAIGSGTSIVLTGVIRENSTSSPRNAKMRQSVVIEVTSAA